MENYAFSNIWFRRHQRWIRWIANSWLSEPVFRFKRFGVELDATKKVAFVTPSSVAELHKKNGDGTAELREHFLTKNEYALRLRKIFYPVWLAMHCWDWVVADRFVPVLSFGFSTLTVNPQAGGGGGNATCDGYVRTFVSGAGTTWASLHGSSSGYAAGTSDANLYIVSVVCGTTTSQYQTIWRAILSFNTSSLTSAATISGAVLSLYGTSSYTVAQTGYAIDVFTATPANVNNIVVGDYAQFQATSQTGGASIAFPSWSTSGYNAFTLSATGIGNVSKTGVSVFSLREASYDAANTAPPWVSSQNAGLGGYFADNGSNEPKLVVTYTAPATAEFFPFF